MSEFNFEENVKRIKAKLRPEIEPFLNTLRSKPREDLKVFKADWRKFCFHRSSSLDIVNLFIDEVDAKALKVSIKEQVFALFTYLGIVESLGNCLVNILVMILVVNGRDFHIGSAETSRIRHVYSLDEIEKARVPLTMKLNFLRDNGIKIFPSIIDSKLRNDIAHLNFNIEKGKVTVRGRSVWEIVEPNSQKILSATVAVSELIDDLAEDFGWNK